MIQIQNSDVWLHRVAARLQSHRFVPMTPQSYQAAGFKFAAHRSRFEIMKFGMAETFFIFADISELTHQSMTSFSNTAFQFAIRSKSVPLPRGLFESVWCFAVAITNNLHPQVAESIRGAVPRKHWSAGEIPVAFDAATGLLCYFEKTPVWGAAYYAAFRRQIQTYLG